MAELITLTGYAPTPVVLNGISQDAQTITMDGVSAVTLSGTGSVQQVEMSGLVAATGPKGEPGADSTVPGPQGDPGPANTLSIGTVTSSTTPAATITGTAPNQTLNLVLAKGDKGDTGATGPAGTTDYTLLTNKPTLGTAAAKDATYFATAAQGAKADTAVQPAAIANFETSTQLDTRDTADRARANHTGTQAISTVTGLQTALDDKQAVGDYATTSDLTSKQDTLVSGTNIKTVNGTSLLGAGDVVISGGGTSVSDATTTTKGIVQLAGDLSGTADAPTVPALANKVNSADLATALDAKVTGPASVIQQGIIPQFADTTGKVIEASSLNASGGGLTVQGPILSEGSSGAQGIQVNNPGNEQIIAMTSGNSAYNLAGDGTGLAYMYAAGVMNAPIAVLDETTDTIASAEWVYPGATTMFQDAADHKLKAHINGSATLDTIATEAYVDTAVSGSGGGTTLPADATGWLHDNGSGTLVWSTPSKSDVGLSNVDNTSDATKNAAAAVLTNKDLTSATNTFPTLNQNTTGSAAKLTTARTINGVSFDGTANITVADSTKVPTTRTVNGHALSANVTVTATDVGLGNVNNTSDASKPISTATQTALNGKVNGTVTITVGTTAPASPATGDLWVDTN